MTVAVGNDVREPALKAPFPYFGGKSRIAPLVWSRFGGVRSYVEPFAGSLAVLLARPEPFDGVETINDADAFVSNFWRALQAAPDEVARWADYPAFENDLHARHIWLVERAENLRSCLEGDPDYFDAKAAGWWAWGLAQWIGSGFASGKGAWRVVEKDGMRQLRKSDAGQGVTRKRVHLSNTGQGVTRKLVHLSVAGQGVTRKLVHLSVGSNPGSGECGLLAWMQALAERLRRVRVCCGDWTRVCGGRSGHALRHLTQQTPCAVFLDPPYSAEANRDNSIYRSEDLTVAHAVRKWAIAHGDDRRFRIALCGYEGEHAMPASWECVAWKTKGGMANVGDKQGRANSRRERIWFSPHCLAEQERKAS